jgi:hypothetical protein
MGEDHCQAAERPRFFGYLQAARQIRIGGQQALLQR